MRGGKGGGKVSPSRIHHEIKHGREAALGRRTKQGSLNKLVKRPSNLLKLVMVFEAVSLTPFRK